MSRTTMDRVRWRRGNSAIWIAIGIVGAVLLSQGWGTAGEANATALFDAAAKNDVDSLRRLRRQGVNVNAADESGATAMHFAAVNHNALGAIQCLFEMGGDVNAEDKQGNTPMFAAASAGAVEMMRRLKGLGADINHRAKSGQTPMFYAALRGQEQAMTWLKEKGADVDARDEATFTPMFMAVYGGLPRSITCLKKLGADVNAKATSEKDPELDGYTPMHLAAGTGNVDVLRVLKELGANPRAKTRAGKTPLDEAIKREQDQAEAWLRTYDKPVLPVEISFRGSFLDLSGIDVLKLKNTSAKPLPFTLEIVAPKTGQSKSIQITLDPGSVKEVGFLEGWEFDFDETITLSSSGFRTDTYTITLDYFTEKRK